MQVQFLKQESKHISVMWEVREGRKWWTATWSAKEGGWTIMTGTTRQEVWPGGRLGKKIIAAIEAYKVRPQDQIRDACG